jgi:hypothetical protein
MRDFYNLENYHYGKSSKKPYNRGKSFGYQVLGFGSGVAAAGFLPTQIGCFAFGKTDGGKVSTSNLVNTSGVISSDVSGVGTVRDQGYDGGATYGFDKGIFCFGEDNTDFTAITNLCSATGVVATDTAAVSGVSGRYSTGGGYGGDKGIVAMGYSGGPSGVGYTGISNLISSEGVVAADVSTPGSVTGRAQPMLCPFGLENSNTLIAYGNTPAAQNMSNIVSTEGVIGADITGVGTAKGGGGACRYSEGLGVIAYGTGVAPAPYYNNSNKVNISGVVATDTSGVGTARYGVAACGYGGDKGIFAFGAASGNLGISNLVNTSGVVSSDVAAVGTARNHPGSAGIGT